MDKKRLVIFGLSGDPVTISHLRIIFELSKKFDKVVVVPNLCDYYRKEPFMFTFEYRAKLLDEAVSKLKRDNINVLIIEKFLPKRHTYIDTLEAIQKLCGEDWEYYTAIGADSYNNLTTWRKWKSIIKKSKIVVFLRKDNDLIANDKIPYELMNLAEYSDYKDDGSATKYRHDLHEVIIDHLFYSDYSFYNNLILKGEIVI